MAKIVTTVGKVKIVGGSPRTEHGQRWLKSFNIKIKLPSRGKTVEVGFQVRKFQYGFLENLGAYFVPEIVTHAHAQEQFADSLMEYTEEITQALKLHWQKYWPE